MTTLKTPESTTPTAKFTPGRSKVNEYRRKKTPVRYKKKKTNKKHTRIPTMIIITLKTPESTTPTAKLKKVNEYGRKKTLR